MDESMDDREQRIRELAYRLWQEAGAPEGRAEEFWLGAEQKLHGEAAEAPPAATAEAEPAAPASPQARAKAA